MEMHFKVYRFDPSRDRGPYFRHYTLSAEPSERILDCLNRIRWEQDGTLGLRMSCGHGVCGSDAMRINGTCRLACQALVRDYQCPEVVIEPLPGFAVMKDLIVDMDDFLKKVESVRPYLTAGETQTERERLQSPEERKKIDSVIRCILCACCTGACPVSWMNKDYLGPAALVWAHRYIFDSRDGKRTERLSMIDHPDGVWGCAGHFECTRVCPKEIPVTKAINEMKRSIRHDRE